MLIQHCDECDGFAGVYPEHKHMIVTALQAKGRLVGMTGGCLYLALCVSLVVLCVYVCMLLCVFLCACVCVPVCVYE